MSNPIIVVGGGLGGLTAALALGQRGINVHVIEQAAEIAPIGYGIQLGPNVFHVLERLGVKADILKVSHLPPSIMMVDALTGEPLIDAAVNAGSYNDRFKQPYVVVHRADLHHCLLEACRGLRNVELTVSVTASRVEQDGGRAQVICEDGRVFAGVGVVAADGLKSRMRDRMVPADAPKPNGYVAHRSILNMADVPANTPFMEQVVLWAGPGCHVVHYPLRGRSIFNVVVVFRPRGSGSADECDYAEQIRNVYSATVPSLRALVGKVDPSRRWQLADRDPIRHWCDGRVALLGDAAHPTFQTLAQGACMAIEDAYVLADCIAGENLSLPAAFQAYERRRVLRSARVQLTSRSVWSFYHEEGIARDVRNEEARAIDEKRFYDCVSWVWNADPSIMAAA
jgi:2-polyprenyl-6-methoxyphenol hydroxylase-like FAD-dependent oxidoreductase